MKVSLNKDDMWEGSGSLFDDFDGTIVEARTGYYNNRRGDGTTVTFTRKGGEVVVQDHVPGLLLMISNPNAERPFECNYKAYETLVPTADGSGFEYKDPNYVPKEGRKGGNIKDDAFFFLAKAAEHGLFSGDDVRKLRGVSAHFERQVVDPTKVKEGKRAWSVLVPTGPPSAPTGIKVSGTLASDPKIVAIAKKLVLAVLAKKNPVEKIVLGQAANKALEGKPEKAAVVNLVLDDAFLKGSGGEWVFDGRSVSKAQEEAGLDDIAF